MNAPFSTSVWLVVAILAGVVALALLGVVFAGPQRAAERRTRARLGSFAGGPRGRLGWLRRFASGAERAADRGGLGRGIDSLLEQTNLPLSPGEAVLVGLAVAGLAGLVTAAVTGSPVLGVTVWVLTLAVLVVAVREAAARERRRFEGQLPDTLNLLATSLRAGYSLLQSIEAVSEQSPDPTNREFGRAISEIRLGRAVPEALQSVADRVQSVDFSWAVMAMEIQREVGGNLAEVLTSASTTLVARTRLRREIRALTAEGRLTAVVLTLVPFGLFGFIWVVNRDYLDPLLEETLGVIALASAGALMAIGIYWLRKIVDVEI